MGLQHLHLLHAGSGTHPEHAGRPTRATSRTTPSRADSMSPVHLCGTSGTTRRQRSREVALHAWVVPPNP
eukprot:124053-Chlamydomonas_euryale.AAC.5